MKVHTAIARTLGDLGVQSMFGVLGDGNMFFVDRFVTESSGRYVAAANEAGAVMMASGYGIARGSPGVATVTHGPGLANTFASLVSAARERTPMVVLAGDTSAKVRNHSQRIDQASVVAPTGAGFEAARSGATAPEDLARAFRRAVAERRPIVYNVSVDVMFEEVAGPAAMASSAPAHQAIQPDPDVLDRAVGLMASARRPLVLAGLGVAVNGAGESVARLAERLDAVLATTLPAKGLFGRSRRDVGVFGSLSSPRAVEAIQASDCVVALGTSLSRLTGGGDGWPYFRDKRLVQCDIASEALGRELPVDVAVLGDAGIFADTVVEWLDLADHHATGFSTEFSARSEAPQPTALSSPSEEYADLRVVLDDLNRRLPEERSLVVDGGRFTSTAVQVMDVSAAEKFSFSGRGFGAVGNGVATAIGMGCARPDAPAVAIVGDGGFMLGGLAEFNTAVRHGVDLVVVVCNDGSYGAEYRKLTSRDFDVSTSLFAWPDFAPVAVSLGGEGVTVRGTAELAQVGDVLDSRSGPVLIDVKLDPSTMGHGE